MQNNVANGENKWEDAMVAKAFFTLGQFVFCASENNHYVTIKPDDIIVVDDTRPMWKLKVSFSNHPSMRKAFEKGFVSRVFSLKEYYTLLTEGRVTIRVDVPTTDWGDFIDSECVPIYR